ncbi:unnamed protein product [Orchesella dallaii]|uniref:Uncharacterized protein n=1 Tax=Orchesella dallaii TaxID=48710 RepID=A0ABP1R6M1_9HEXA
MYSWTGTDGQKRIHFRTPSKIPLFNSRRHQSLNQWQSNLVHPSPSILRKPSWFGVTEEEFNATSIAWWSQNTLSDYPQRYNLSCQRTERNTDEVERCSFLNHFNFLRFTVQQLGFSKANKEGEDDAVFWKTKKKYRTSYS